MTAVLLAGLLRFLLSITGAPAGVTRFASMTVVLLAACVYFGARRLSWRHRLAVSYLLILPYMAVELAALGYTWASGRPTIFHAEEYSFGVSLPTHFWGHLVGGATWEPLLLFVAMLAVRGVVDFGRRLPGGPRDAEARPPSGLTRRTLYTTVGLLVAIGVIAAAARVRFPGDLALRLEPARAPVLEAFAVVDTRAAGRDAEVMAFDVRFASHPTATLLHVVPGGLFLALAPLQFWSRLRQRRRVLHRWSGRILVALATVTTSSGLFFGVLMPFGGAAEATAIVVFGSWLLACLSRAVLAIRRGRIAVHREWMIRGFAAALGISSVRLVGAPLDLILTAAGVGPRPMFAASVWTGWLLTIALAEAWLRASRTSVASRIGAGAA
jgi:uncharacterized membrane protein